VLTIVFFQLRKRTTQTYVKKEKELAKIEANSSYVELFSHIPVYQDSVFRIYIANLTGDDEIIYLRKDILTEQQEKSKFFLHVYPVNKELLSDNKLGNLSYDFKSNFESFKYLGEDYFVAHRDLPEIAINKINTGQYGFKGDGKISWKTKDLLTQEDIIRTLQANKVKAFQFN